MVMARSIWSGTFSFGLITIPVKLFTAVRSKGCRSTSSTSATWGASAT